MSFHTILALVFLQAKLADKCLATGIVFVHIMSLEVGKMLYYFSTLKTLMALRNMTHWEALK